ncbi:MAG TPA: HAMP domain-containing histidine kinase [Candidatus Protoclostridium stercorigallinarum]|uniref:histidine kinase n=1 Tax=Candidatus Protoclostridium stercorigallinarum TaxID=2838741 RepID=A0A9D1Q1L1_9FIRM|nr:HAMP domain-containing histidine kinase [Candidatus Protoclostridium stercorigallinarum]
MAKTGGSGKEKKTTATSRLFRKMQLKFTAFVAAICVALVTVSFVALTIVNTVSMEMSVGDMMDEAIRVAIEDMERPAPSDDGPRPDCLVVIARPGDRPDEMLAFGSLGSDVELTESDAEELIRAAVSGETDVRINDLIVRVRTLVEYDEEGRFGVYAFYDFTDRYSIYVSQTLGMLFSFLALAIILTLFTYMMSGVMLSPVRDSLVRQKDLVANASHELKTPITIINANLDVIKNAPESADNGKWIDNIEAQTKRMNELIIEMLEMCSFESDAYRPEIKEFDLGEMAEGCCLSFEAACFEKGVSIKYEGEGDTVIRSDEKGWTKLVGILLDNAVKYSPDGGRISVRIERRKKQIFLYVGNDGEIPPEIRGRIFDRFYKAGDGSGSFGLGLSVAKVIVNGMNGTIECSSKGGRTVFTVAVPLKQEA